MLLTGGRPLDVTRLNEARPRSRSTPVLRAATRHVSLSTADGHMTNDEVFLGVEGRNVPSMKPSGVGIRGPSTGERLTGLRCVGTGEALVTGPDFA